jgi:predicted NBD/HSP70 family sugar kinase
MRYQVMDIGGSSVKGAVFETAADGKLRIVEGPWSLDEPQWEGFERWVVEAMPLAADVTRLGVSTAGFIDTHRGVVELFPAAGWTDKPLATDLGRAYGVPITLLNDGEAHLCAHRDLHPLPQITIAFGTALAFGLADENGGIVRPRSDRNFDIGEWRIPTHADNTAVWWALGSEGLDDLLAAEGEPGGYRHWGYRMGQFLVSLAAVFQPRSIIISGGRLQDQWPSVEPALRAAFAKNKPQWLEAPLIQPSPYGWQSALYGMAKYLATTERLPGRAAGAQ